MNFFDFVKTTGYAPVTVAQALLYGTDSPRLKKMLALFECSYSESERKALVQVASGNKTAFRDFYESKSTQTDTRLDQRGEGVPLI